MTLILEVEENGALTLPPELLGNAKPHTRYVVEAQGEKLTLRPEGVEPVKPRKSRKKREMSWDEWEQERAKLSEELGKIWPEGLSVTDVISEMRR